MLESIICKYNNDTLSRCRLFVWVRNLRCSHFDSRYLCKSNYVATKDVELNLIDNIKFKSLHNSRPFAYNETMRKVFTVIRYDTFDLCNLYQYKLF